MRSAGAGPRVGPAAVFSAWDAQGHASRRELYAYVSATFGKRVTALAAEEIDRVLQWIATPSPITTLMEGHSDAA